MKLINKEQVSHIAVFKETEGVWCSWEYWAKLKYLLGSKGSFWKSEVKSGFYENGKNFITNMYRSEKQVRENSKEWFIRDSSVWTFPFIQIFCGKDVIHKEYFTTFVELEQHIKDNYNHCTIRYE